MNTTKKVVIGFVLCFALIAGLLIWNYGMRYVGNKYNYAIQKLDASTKYETIKKVEDTCRAMISSYTSDKLTYDQYKDSDNTEKQSWAEQAKMRANKTASTYNNYILQNSFVWEDNVPNDIDIELAYIN